MPKTAGELISNYPFFYSLDCAVLALASHV